MKVTEVDLVRSERAIPLPEPWRAAWREPSGKPLTSLGYGFYMVHTYRGISVLGLYTGCEDFSMVEGFDPCHVEAFWKEPILIDGDGCVRVPNRPGIGVEIDEEKLSAGLVM